MAKDCTNVAITKAFLLGGCHPSAQTLGSRKLNFVPGNKNWIPVSGHWDDKEIGTGMTPTLCHSSV
ncbi:hypothetical protein [Wolbachia endosymbiont (group A) of Agelastica alni]|uniref:hypothetical protein n=1 Tax=Wolbachia endosymbiont (group A) of Agelastica alni TaxID=3066130 RepID=UPI003978CA3A